MEQVDHILILFLILALHEFGFMTGFLPTGSLSGGRLIQGAVKVVPQCYHCQGVERAHRGADQQPLSCYVHAHWHSAVIQQ